MMGFIGFESSPKLFTEADLAVLPEEFPSGPVEFELDDGRLVARCGRPAQIMERFRP